MSEMTRGSAGFAASLGRWKIALAVMGLLALAAVSGLALQRAFADGPGCPDGYGCVWRQVNFNGDRSEYDGSWGDLGWFPLGYEYNSAKNRYGNRRLKVGKYDQLTGEITVVKGGCLDPQEERPSLPDFDLMNVGGNGTHCNN